MISIITNTIGTREKYIRLAGDSLVNQTIKDIEWIIVSSQNSDFYPKLIADYQKINVKLNEIIQIVRRTGALEATRHLASTEAERAIAALSYLPKGPYKEALHGLAAQLLSRRH